MASLIVQCVVQNNRAKVAHDQLNKCGGCWLLLMAVVHRYLVVMLLGAAATVVGFVGMNLTLRWCRLRREVAAS